jgi:hypothetical protein
MGEAPFEAIPPIGYPEFSSAWVSEGTFLRRINYAYYASGALLGFAPLPALTAETPEQVVDHVAARFVHGRIGSQTRAALLSVVLGHNTATRVQHAAAAILASPEFMSQ